MTVGMSNEREKTAVSAYRNGTDEKKLVWKCRRKLFKNIQVQFRINAGSLSELYSYEMI